MDDLDLARTVTRGDREAFQRIIDEHASAVYRTCYRILRDSRDAEDATQETFIAAYRAMGSYRGEGSLAAWLSRIAARRSFAIVGRRRPMESLEISAATVPVSDDAGDPEVSAIRADRRRRLIALVATLPETHREVIALLYFGDRTLVEIAQLTGRPIGTVKTHLHRGLVQLRRSMEERRDA